jgi:hypothetical protein
MDTITEDALDKEVMKRIRKRVTIGRTRFLWILAFNIIGTIALYLFLLIIGGMEFAVENMVLVFAPILLIEGLGFLGYLIFLFFNKIPEEIYLEQKKIIEERLPNELALDIKRGTNLLTRDGKDVIGITLLVTNREKKKIVEFQALVNFEHFYLVKDRDSVRQTGYEWNKPLFWIGDGQEADLTEIELRPDTQKVVAVSELQDMQTNNGEAIRLTLICCNPTITSLEFAEESIYQVKIRFQGKLEGEYDFRTFHYEVIFYAKPENQRMLPLKAAENTFPDIPKRLLERSKEVIKYMANIENDKEAQ